MPLPYASDSPPTRRPAATIALLGINIALTAIFQLGMWDGRWQPQAFLTAVGIVPAHFHPYSLVTYMFFHASIAHLLLNMFYLWVFGGGVEEALGRGRFLVLYILSGVVGGGLQCLITIKLLAAGGEAPIVGASAACAGLVGLYAMRYYRARLSFVLLPFRPHVVTVISAFLLYEIGSGLWYLAQGSTEGSVAHWAHIGGFVFGLSSAQLLRLTEEGRRAYFTQDAARAMAQSVPGAAIKRWEEMLAHEPGNVQAHTELARAWLALGDKEQAVKHFRPAIDAHLRAHQRPKAAQIYAEMREHGLKDLALPVETLYALGNALEEIEQFGLAAETFRMIATRNPDSSEAETALLKVIALYIHNLDRREEARILLRLFIQRYPRSPWRILADDLAKSVVSGQ